MNAFSSTTLAWRIAKRELRGGLAGFRVFVICLALGVAAIAVVGWSTNRPGLKKKLTCRPTAPNYQRPCHCARWHRPETMPPAHWLN
jgi:hypothetical protein